jgi:hypothetical protein
MNIGFGVLNLMALMLASALYVLNQEVYVQSMCVSLALTSTLNLGIFPFRDTVYAVKQQAQGDPIKRLWLQYQIVLMLGLAWVIATILPRM